MQKSNIIFPYARQNIFGGSMKSFFKQYSYNVVKDLLNQFAISIFGSLLAMATIAAENTTLSIVVSIFSIVFYLFLVYTTTWEIGAKDRVSVDVGKKPYRPHTGLLISAISNIPKFIIALLFLVATFIITNQSVAANLEVILSLAYMLLGGMYTGLMTSANMISAWWAYLVFIIPALLTSWVAYYAGFKNFRLIAPLFDKKKK